MRRLQGAAFDFVPRFFILPRDYEEFRADYSRHPNRLYIRKVACLPAAACPAICPPPPCRGGTGTTCVTSALDAAVSICNPDKLSGRDKD
jgi:hypothetical protein